MSLDLDALLAQAKTVAPSSRQYLVPRAEPTPQPPEQPWHDFALPPQAGLSIPALIKTAYNSRRTRYEQLHTSLLQDQQHPSGLAGEIWVLGWQVDLLERILTGITTGATPPVTRRLQGEGDGAYRYRQWLAWENREHAAVPLTTPGGLTVVLVPWLTGQQTELTAEGCVGLVLAAQGLGMTWEALLDRAMAKPATQGDLFRPMPSQQAKELDKAAGWA